MTTRYNAENLQASIVIQGKGNFHNAEIQNMNQEKQINKSKKIFVIHGRNSQLRSDFFSFLRALRLEPIEWSEAIRMTGKGSPYIGDILDVAFENAQAIVVLLTPDDEVRLKEEFWSDNEHENEINLIGQARPNVLFEAGLAFGKNPDRTILIEVGDVKSFSDVAGRHIIRLNNSMEKRQEIATRLENAQCNVSVLHGTDWHKVGNFEIKNVKKNNLNSIIINNSVVYKSQNSISDNFNNIMHNDSFDLDKINQIVSDDRFLQSDLKNPNSPGRMFKGYPPYINLPTGWGRQIINNKFKELKIDINENFSATARGFKIFLSDKYYL